MRDAIDPGAKTATLVETVTDPGVTSSSCCGGERRTAISFPGLAVYRIRPIGPGVPTPDGLRAAMDARFPDVGVTEAVDPGQPRPFPRDALPRRR